MIDIFSFAARPPEALFFKKNDSNDIRLGEIVSSKPEDYEQSEIVILGCPQDEGVRRNKGRIGASQAPDEIRRAFYKLTNFGIAARIFDLGNTEIKPTLEKTHEAQTAIVRQILKDGKRIVSLGGGNDISYPDCRALSETVGADNVLAFNIDAHFDVRADEPPNSGTPYRQLLEEKLVLPRNFCEIAIQTQANSPVYFAYLHKLGVTIKSLEEVQNFIVKNENPLAFALDAADSKNKSVFFGFDADSVRAADAPGTSAPSPIGLTAEEFCALAAVAGGDARTKIIEFTEMNPEFDIDGRTAKLVAIAIHRYCTAISKIA